MGIMGSLWPWILTMLSLLGLSMGAPSASRCSGVCSTSVPEGFTPEGSPVFQDKDIPAINQGLISEETPESSFLVEGDIIRPSPFRLLSVTNNKWPKGVGGFVEIPFLLSRKYDELSRRVIMDAFAEFERFTCIRFVAYHGQRDFVSILPMAGCFSGVGRSGGMQVVSLAPTCLRKGRGIVLHELMHVLGFWHEHSRADRDRYIQVNWNEILPGFEINFIKSRSTNMLVPYDYSSVMHYGRFAFSWRGQPTIIPLWTSSVHIGQRWNLSTSDITRVCRLYNCSRSVPDSHGRGFEAQSDGSSLTPASISRLQRLLEALSEESGSSAPSGSRTGGQSIAGLGNSQQGWEHPPQSTFSVGALARPPQMLADASKSGPGAGADSLSLEQFQLAQAPTVPLALFPEARDKPAPIQDAFERLAPLPGGCAPGSHIREVPRD
ncbi:astacin-like metalloendopeptidase isoform a precursor [Mus musculus]|uniref:Astacin-like metalloendopeptidase n=3 Tax=Mus musculus TaxID=10090 RepID=ASTL_MOUSE|nr:astacin-like metalloendopeptidase isoform a precursor [Mus musculus]Q6HA09.3 RecName: Full=Astacin-like metalloendopeptidase; AltName: Full=Oocyte astacin; AltName: Full=Ovastacin; AltName: Full=Sperm acrosomal SLLP1-binding protein; Flags: Precursor [Mus musculus]AAH64729.2 Astl protein [Mus musculus]ACN71160.1 sperm acrosomal SLLP1 receptor variant 1 [Mus musculus]|eukprot:NP_001277932.1 astacin-like metalloendopeptidase isoform a precursor [Mus musculus]